MHIFHVMYVEMISVNNYCTAQILWKIGELQIKGYGSHTYPMCVEKETRPVWMCTICNNSGDRAMIIDCAQGIFICLGVDGLGCGIVSENLPVYTTQCMIDFINPYEQFS